MRNNYPHDLALCVIREVTRKDFALRVLKGNLLGNLLGEILLCVFLEIY
jgi:hypothetical protein